MSGRVFSSFPSPRHGLSQDAKKLLLISIFALILLYKTYSWSRRSGDSMFRGVVADDLADANRVLRDAVRKAKSPFGYDAGGLKFAKDGNFHPTKSWDVCVVGAGLSGAVMAERYANVLGKTSLVLDIREHIGGNLYDFRFKGILMNLYGAHLWHSNSERAFKYVTKWNEKAPWVRWDHTVVGWIENQLLPIPVNINTVNSLFNLNIESEEEMKEWLSSVQIPCPNGKCENAEEMAKTRVGEKLFNAIFRDYTRKQWDRDAKDLDPLVTARIPVRSTFDGRYFADKFQILPKSGYTNWFAQVLDSPLIDVVLGTDYFNHKDDLSSRCGKIIFTGPIDRYFANSGLDKLEYRSIDFSAQLHSTPDGGFVQSNGAVNYPGRDVDYTRIIEYKHFLPQYQKSQYSITVSETSSSVGTPYYPVPNPRNLNLYEQYKKLAAKEEKEHNVYFCGRLASYKYFNMDAAILNALSMFEKIENFPDMPDIGPADDAGSSLSDSV